MELVGLGLGLAGLEGSCNGLSDDLSLTTNYRSSSSSFGYCDGQQQQNMLNFSSPKLEDNNLLSSAFPFPFPFHHHPISFYSKTSVRGAFTASQWFELEQQALIYKYIIANQPIPPNLLMPIRRAFESAGFSNFLGGLLRPNTFGYGWGPFHLGLGNTTDPEPGRCRRTDGKKWRCSREAVADQKYCERHMNRGRHRSRKPVEGHSISKKSSSKVVTMGRSTSSPLVLPGGRPSNLDRSKDLLQHVPSNHLSSSLLNRICQGKQDAEGLDFLSPRICLNSSGNAVSVSESAADAFSFLTSTFGAYGQSQNRNAQGLEQPLHSPHSFIDDRSTILWPKVHTQTDRSQLSISIPPSDFNSTLSHLRGSRQELDSIQMGLGLGSISWETSMGGPLGEVLKTSTSSNNSTGSPQLASSPTGVLQRIGLGYSSNSSAGNSLRVVNGKSHDSIGFNHRSSSIIPL